MCKHKVAPLCNSCINFIKDLRSSSSSELLRKEGQWEPIDRATIIAYRRAHPFQTGATSWGVGLVPKYIHHADVEALRKSASQCRLCDMIYRHTYQELEPANEVHVVKLLAFTESSFWNVSFTAAPIGKNKILQIYFRDSALAIRALRDYKSSYPPLIPPGRPIAQHAKSDECRDLALLWLNECLFGHKKCGGKMELLPQRIIDVGKSNGTTEPLLVIESDLNAPFIALSYRRGDLKTSVAAATSIIKAGTQEIPFALLPKTFQDAVWVTRALNFRYLWIEDFCTVQNLGENYTVQDEIRGSIFEGAALTISAAAATDSESGFLHERLSAKNDICCKLDADLASQSDVHVRLEQISIEEELDQLKITKLARNWTERVLSQRVLHFSKEMIAWECPERTISEHEMAGGCGGFSIMTDTFGFLHDPTRYHKKPGIRCENSPFGMELQGWDRIVGHYTTLEWDDESLRLPLLDAIAKRYSPYMTYLAGIWDELLPRALLWRTSDGFAKPAMNSVPSWSWASLRGPVNYDWAISLGGLGTKWIVQILGATVQNLGLSYSGEISGGQLKVFGFLTKASYSLPNPQADSGQLVHKNVSAGSGDGAKIKAWMDVNPATARECWCLWIGSTLVSRGDITLSLLLQKEKSGRLTFKRCGVAEHPSEMAAAMIEMEKRQRITII